MSQKGFAPILIVLIIVALGLGGFFLYQNQTKPVPVTPQPLKTPSPKESTPSSNMSNWKTLYDSDGARLAKVGAPNLKYSFQYPNNFKVDNAFGIDSQELTGFFPDAGSFGTTMHVYTFLIMPDKGESITNIESNIPTELGNKQAKRLIGMSQNPPGSTVVYQTRDLQWAKADKKWGFQFMCTYDNKPTVELIQLCDQIASTFKFLP